MILTLKVYGILPYNANCAAKTLKTWCAKETRLLKTVFEQGPA